MEKVEAARAGRPAFRVFAGAPRTQMLMTVEKAAKVIGTSDKWLREQLDDQHHPLPHVRVGNKGGIRYVNMARVQQWIDARTVGMAELERDTKNMERG